MPHFVMQRQMAKIPAAFAFKSIACTGVSTQRAIFISIYHRLISKSSSSSSSDRRQLFVVSRPPEALRDTVYGDDNAILPVHVMSLNNLKNYMHDFDGDAYLSSTW